MEVEVKPGWRDRLQHLTWAWFLTTMSTGGIAVLINSLPYRFHGLTTIGVVFFILDLVIFLFLCVAIFYRFTRRRDAIFDSFSHAVESLYVPAFLLSVANIIVCIQSYGVPHCGHWLTKALEIVFWAYSAVTFIFAVFFYYALFRRDLEPIRHMCSAWILPVFPIMLSGSIASNVASSQSNEEAIDTIFGGLAFQGLGWTVSLFMSVIVLHEFIHRGVPPPNARPSMFVTVGPAGYTAFTLVSLGRDAGNVFPVHFIAGNGISGHVAEIVGLLMACFVWSIAFWFFSIAVIANLQGLPDMTYAIPCWGLIFPNIGFTLATIAIGEQLQSPAILWVGTAMGIILICFWFFNFFMTIRAVIKRDILHPGRDEDKPLPDKME